VIIIKSILYICLRWNWRRRTSIGYFRNGSQQTRRRTTRWSIIVTRRTWSRFSWTCKCVCI